MNRNWRVVAVHTVHYYVVIGQTQLIKLTQLRFIYLLLSNQYIFTCNSSSKSTKSLRTSSFLSCCTQNELTGNVKRQENTWSNRLFLQFQRTRSLNRCYKGNKVKKGKVDVLGCWTSDSLARKNVDPRLRGFSVMCLTSCLTSEVCALVTQSAGFQAVLKRPKNSSFRSNSAAVISSLVSDRNRNVKYHTSIPHKPGRAAQLPDPQSSQSPYGNS